MEEVAGPVVADGPDGVAHQGGVVHPGLGADLAGQHHMAVLAQHLAGHAGLGVLRQVGVQDGIGDRVGHLVGVALGNGLGGQQPLGPLSGSRVNGHDGKGC